MKKRKKWIKKQIINRKNRKCYEKYKKDEKMKIWF